MCSNGIPGRGLILTLNYSHSRDDVALYRTEVMVQTVAHRSPFAVQSRNPKLNEIGPYTRASNDMNISCGGVYAGWLNINVLLSNLESPLSAVEHIRC
jgi:hypothetical protein